MTALGRIRRGVGVVMIASGLIHAAGNTFASLWASGRVRVAVSPSFWLHLHLGQYLFMVLAGMLYLSLSFWKEGVFYYEALADYLVGLAGFLVVIPFVFRAIVWHVISPWFSLVPGLLLIAYGIGLSLGRRFGMLESTP